MDELSGMASGPVDVFVVPDSIFERMSDVEQSQGILAVLDQRLVSLASLESADRIVALDGVQDPGNVGSVIRTAAWFGVDAVVAGPGTVDMFNPKVVRASMGGLWGVQLAVAEDLSGALRRLSESGYACYGAAMDGMAVRRWRPRLKSVLVLGSEAHGISPAVSSALEGLVAVPGRPGVVESLNVGVAFGTLAHHWTVVERHSE
jgi:TrmH family RNA methyltransferase